MNTKVSKELFFKVKEFKEFDFDYCYDTENEEMEKGIECFYFRCKEWAFNNNYIIEVAPYRVTLSHRRTGKIIKFQYDSKDTKPYLLKYTFKACQWILDNQK